MRSIIGLGVLTSIIALTGAAVAQNLTTLHPLGLYTQAPTGMTYPMSVDEFRRVEIIRYKEDGTDESAGYNYLRPMNEIAATVYVFPSPPVTSIGSPRNVIAEARSLVCQQQFKAIEREVTTAHPDAALTADGQFTLTQGQNAHDGFKVSYDLTNARFFGRQNVTSRSDAYVFCFAGGKWTVEYRFDYPRDFDAASLIADFMRDLAWTITPE
jgi:hypothetical protein